MDVSQRGKNLPLLGTSLDTFISSRALASLLFPHLLCTQSPFRKRTVLEITMLWKHSPSSHCLAVSGEMGPLQTLDFP